MSQQHYYIEEENGQRSGPFDLVSMVRKIRGHRVTPQTMILLDREETHGRPASHLPEFGDIFKEIAGQQQQVATQEPGEFRTIRIIPALKNGIEFVTNNFLATICTGAVLLMQVIAVFLLSMLSFGNSFLHATLAVFVCYFLFAIYQIIILRLSRMQLITPEFLSALLKRSVFPLLIISLAVGFIFLIPVLLSLAVSPLALVLILMPGTLLMIPYLYAPLLVYDQGISASEALSLSKKMMKDIGKDNAMTLYMILLINFVAAAFLLIPVILTLPITLAAMSEIYDEYFSR